MTDAAGDTAIFDRFAGVYDRFAPTLDARFRTRGFEYTAVGRASRE